MDSEISTDGHGKVVVQYERAFEQIADAAPRKLEQLELSYNQAREQAQSWFLFSLVAAGVAFILFGAGVVSVIAGQMTGGLITTLSSVIPIVVVKLFFDQAQSANKRQDEIRLRLYQERKTADLVRVAETISNRKERDRLKQDIVHDALAHN